MDRSETLAGIAEKIGEQGESWADILGLLARIARTTADTEMRQRGHHSEREWAVLVLTYGQLLICNASYHHPDQPEGGEWWDDTVDVDDDADWA